MRSTRIVLLSLAVAGVALSAPAQTFEGVKAGTDIYRVVIADRWTPYGDPWLSGFPGAFTGSSHPLTARMARPAEMLALHRVDVTSDGWNDYGLATIRLWDQRVDIELGTNQWYALDPEPGFACISANEPEPAEVEVVPGDPRAVHAVWRLDAAGAPVEIERLMRVHGDDPIDSRVEVTLTVRNLGADVLRAGARDGMALRINGEPRPSVPQGTTSAAFLVGTRDGAPPPEPLPFNEQEWRDPAFQMWQASSEPTAAGRARTYFVAGPLRGLALDPAPTPPDLLQQVALGEAAGGPGVPGGGPADSCFNWPTPIPPRSLLMGLRQMVMLHTWGDEESRARIIPPFGEISFTTYLVAFDAFPLAADAGADLDVDCDGSGGASVALSGSASTIAPTSGQIFYRWSSNDPAVTFDDASDPLTAAHVAGLGDHELTLTAGVGAFEAVDKMIVRVADASPPLPLDLVATPSILWPPNHVMRAISVEARVEDACDPAPQLRLVSVTSSEPADARGNGDGATAVDIGGVDLGTDDRSIVLRAERAGRGLGRTYTLTYEAVDAAGNTRTGTVDVVVPHDQAGRALRVRR